MPTSAPIEEAALVALLKDRQERGYSELYNRYSAALMSVITKIIPNQDLATDTLQDTFLKIYYHIDSYNEQSSRLYTWISNIARNAAIDKLRSKNYKQWGMTNFMDLPDSDTYGVYFPQVDSIGIRDKMAYLKKEFFHVLDLAYFQGYTQEQISEILQVPLGTVKTWTRSGLKELRKILSAA